MVIRENIPISKLTTMRLGGVARFVITIETLEDIKSAYDFAKKRKLPIWIMGRGANTIGHDDGFDGVIFLNALEGVYFETGRRRVEIPYGVSVDDAALDVDFGNEILLTGMGGVEWDYFVSLACEMGYSGIETMSMIPGSVGAAPVQNIGAYGQEIGSVIESVEAFDLRSGEFVTINKSEMKMGYRHTRFNYGPDAGKYMIISITIRLKKIALEPPFYNSLQHYIDSHEILDFSPNSIRKIVMELRNAKLPDPKYIASAGSFFKNVYVDRKEADAAEMKNIPVWRDNSGNGKINSGWLIEQCGLKGKELFGLKVSDKAALVLINESAKSYADLARARDVIVDTVRKKFGYTLEQEPVEIANVNCDKER